MCNVMDRVHIANWYGSHDALSFHVQGGGIGEGFDDLGSVLVSMWCCTIVYMHTGCGLLYCVEGPFVLEQEK